MEFSLAFDMGNAAFDDDKAPTECARILRKIAALAEAGHDGGSVYDVNGNRIGSWSADWPERSDTDDE
jgi:hypothetical protein